MGREGYVRGSRGGEVGSTQVSSDCSPPGWAACVHLQPLFDNINIVDAATHSQVKG